MSVLLEVAEESDADSVICNLADPEGQTALHIASILGISEIVELLLLHGADLTCVDSHGHSPLHLSAGSGSVACLAAILDHGGDFLLENKVRSLVAFPNVTNNVHNLSVFYFLGQSRKHCIAPRFLLRTIRVCSPLGGDCSRCSGEKQSRPNRVQSREQQRIP